ncbi:hypothetical protein C8R45DRAFT_25747 [Mycena sanguinolenta]|nr:hypothetical protein C8R45DRAFT_25747 [Mycena sanguinolenta]
MLSAPLALLFTMARHPLPFNSHHTDEPLYAVADSTHVPTPDVPSLEALIASERISLRADGVSGFFKALCQRYRPPPPPRQTGTAHSEAENAAAVDPSDFPVKWKGDSEESAPPNLLQSKDEPAERQQAKTDPPESESLLQDSFAPSPENEELPETDSRSLPERFRDGMLQKAIYESHGKWAYAAGLPFRESEASVILSSGVMCSAFLKTGHIGERPVRFVSKMWLTKEKWHGFFSELALYKLQLKSLQGRVVPTIINVYSCPGAVDVAMEPPHHSFWIEASADMPHVLKKRCVEAFEKLHSAGVLHGDVELRHMLIGGDARVTIIDFQASRALKSNPAVSLEAATPDEFRMEMRKVKFKLDYEDARAREDEKLMRAARLARRNHRGRSLEEPLHEDVVDPPIDSRVWNLEWVGAPVGPTRFIMPGQSAEDVERAVEDFLDVLQLLEMKERPRRDEPITRRRPSPDFKPPAVVPSKSLGMQPPGKGFGAVVTPARPQKPSSDLKSPVVILSGAPTVTTTALKRKGDCDHLQEDRKRIRVDTRTTSTSRSPPSSYEAFPPRPLPVRDLAREKSLCQVPRQFHVTPTPALAPRMIGTATTSTSYSPPRAHEGLFPAVTRPLSPLRVRDSAYEMPSRCSATLPLQSQLTPTRAPPPRLNPSSPTSSAKRKRAADPEESLETRGQPKMRLSCNVSGPSCDRAIDDVPPVRESKDIVYDPYPMQPLFPTPLLSIRFVENMWRLVS